MDCTLQYLERVFNFIENTIKESYQEPSDLEKHMESLKVSETLFSNYPFIHNAIRESVMRNFINSRPRESDVHDWFIKNHENIILDHKIIKRINNAKHIPDAWLCDQNGEHVPVEMKLDSFDNRHLQQLLRYMDFYQCNKGIAIGRKLNCKLPGNVVFIKHGLE